MTDHSLYIDSYTIEAAGCGQLIVDPELRQRRQIQEVGDFYDGVGVQVESELDSFNVDNGLPGHFRELTFERVPRGPIAVVLEVPRCHDLDLGVTTDGARAGVNRPPDRNSGLADVRSRSSVGGDEQLTVRANSTMGIIAEYFRGQRGSVQYALHVAVPETVDGDPVNLNLSEKTVQ